MLFYSETIFYIGIEVVILTDGYACYKVTISHCVSDGMTYYKLMDQINRILNHQGNTIEYIDWSNPAIASHEIFPETFSEKDIQTAYGVPFFLGLLKNLWNIQKQKKSYLVLNKEKIEYERKRQSSLHNGHVSANDVITAALCEANQSTDIFAFTMNMRKRHCRFGGNFHAEIPFLKTDSTNPREFRKIIKRRYYFKTDELPICPFILGKVGRISSLATIQTLILPQSMEVVCHAMLASYEANIPMDAAFITSMNNENYLVIHNFREWNLVHGGLLQKILKSEDPMGNQ
jgi:hypothetical protein